MMKFKSRIDSFFLFFLAVLVALFIWVLIMELGDVEGGGNFFGSISTTCIIVMILWFSLTCSYFISDSSVKYKWGPVKGSVEIKSIHKIEKGAILWTGIRPATALRGIVLTYGKSDQIYLSPKNEELFIQELLKRNPDIDVIQKK